MVNGWRAVNGWRGLSVLLLGLNLAGCSGSDSGNDNGGELSRPIAPTPGSVCAQSRNGVTIVERPMFPDRADSPMLGYSFKIHPGTNPNAPVVIYLPGGPGQAGISMERELDQVPEEYTLIQTDPRGVGCNAAASVGYYPDEFYNSVWFAGDVLAIVQHLGLTNYILYGISYGTVLATLTASKAEAQGITPPRALVLEGVLGTTFSSESQEVDAFQGQWQKLRDRLPPDVREQFTGTPLPLKLSADQWGAGLTTMLSIGTFERPYSFAEGWLLNLSAQATVDDRNALHDMVLKLAAPFFGPFETRLHDVVMCHEITETDFASLTLKDGNLVSKRSDCLNQPLDRAFAASDWPVTSPIYYFSGSDDPNTPPWQAKAHFDAQVHARRKLVTVADAGHNPVYFNLEDCVGPLWTAIANDSGFDDALRTCTWPTELTTAEAN